MNTNKINWTNAIIAGIVGTIAFDIVGFAFTGQWWDIAGLIGEKTGLGMAYGVLAHYGNGLFLAILYAGIAPSLPGPNWLKAQYFSIIETVILVWLFMFPLLGAGIAGTKASSMYPIVSMVRHIAYAIPLWYFIHNFKYVKNDTTIK